MANDLNTPSFNLGDDNDDFSQFQMPPKEETPVEPPKSKPKLMFEDTPMETPPVPEDTAPPPSKKAKGKAGKGEPKETKPSSKKWLLLLLALIVIMAAGLYFLHSQGYLNLNKVGESISKLSSSVFGKSKSDSVEVVDDEAEGAHKVDSTKAQAKTETAQGEHKAQEEVKKEGEHKESAPKEEVKENKEIAKTPETKVEKKPETEIKKAEPVTKKPEPVVKKTEPIVKKAEVKKEEKHPVTPAKSEAGLKKFEKKATAPKETVTNETVKGDFSVQVASVQNKSKADNEAVRIRKLGFNTFVRAVKLDNRGGWWYRVLIGPYRNKEAAESQLTKIKNKLNVDGIIREK
jgi:cell division protein FtsN